MSIILFPSDGARGVAGCGGAPLKDKRDLTFDSHSLSWFRVIAVTSMDAILTSDTWGTKPKSQGFPPIYCAPGWFK